ncbi:hypothetical protein F5Y17DRAFT_365790 [Xylariaceae sp. FL0594]|nr:hypothetical protein F5Y17DRAFT_365790 [Xylariaceae sp. FL0594]
MVDRNESSNAGREKEPILGSDTSSGPRRKNVKTSTSVKRSSKAAAAGDEETGDGVTGSGADADGQKSPPLKRRRRAFSCLSCQKLKCRCEYDVGAQGCHRCQTLRITCSLRGQDDVTSPRNAGTIGQVSSPSVEERLQRHENALEEIKAMIQALRPDKHGPAHTQPSEERAQSTGHDQSDPEYLSNPVDRGSKSAPIVVLREISQNVMGYRRLLSHGHHDLVQLHLLDEQAASELIEIYIKHQGHTLLVRSPDDLRHRGDERQVSAFLHSVCCLMGIVYREDICGTQLHRQIYDQVRMTLGQAALSSPLDLDDLNAMFIMSNNANTPNHQGAEYIDSWLLTGYCAKQAMLSIYFTHIVSRLKKGSSTVEDHKAIHLWSTICLHHLHWAATTGRPSVIPKGYLDQCNVLLSFYQATMQDGMLVAEIMLYSILHQKIQQESYPSDGGECEEFRSWKHKWNHLLVLPTSSTLRIGYNAACLILAVRALGKTGHAPGSTTFLSTDKTPMTNNDGTPLSEQQGHDTPSRGRRQLETDRGEETRDSTQKRAADDSSDDLASIKHNVCKYAKLILETFIEMPAFLMDATTTCTNLCIGYCALVLAHYDSTQSQIPDAVVLRLVTRLYRWVRTSPGKAWSNKYANLARQKVEARINGLADPRFQGHEDEATRDHEHHGRRKDQEHRYDRNEYHHGETQTQQHHDPHMLGSHGPANERYHIEDMLAGHAAGPNEGLPSLDLGAETMFPSMEGFFGGGFLDFMG